jgi:hypothetical protein
LTFNICKKFDETSDITIKYSNFTNKVVYS